MINKAEKFKEEDRKKRVLINFQLIKQIIDDKISYTEIFF